MYSNNALLFFETFSFIESGGKKVSRDISCIIQSYLQVIFFHIGKEAVIIESPFLNRSWGYGSWGNEVNGWDYNSDYSIKLKRSPMKFYKKMVNTEFFSQSINHLKGVPLKLEEDEKVIKMFSSAYYITVATNKNELYLWKKPNFNDGYIVQINFNDKNEKIVDIALLEGTNNDLKVFIITNLHQLYVDTIFLREARSLFHRMKEPKHTFRLAKDEEIVKIFPSANYVTIATNENKLHFFNLVNFQNKAFF